MSTAYHPIFDRRSPPRPAPHESETVRELLERSRTFADALARQRPLNGQYGRAS